MSAEKKYVLAVPNFSEGRDKDIIEQIVNTVRNLEGVKLISYEPEEDFNRTVVTMIGEPQPIKKALIMLAKKSTELINMLNQKGTHPRIGSQDTLPIFPFKNITLEECITLAEEIGKEFFEETKIPVIFSGENARSIDRKSFAFIRKGQYEGLKSLLKETRDDKNKQEEYMSRKPDYSLDGLLSETCGATIVSTELNGLTAYNVYLGSENLDIAKAIAKGVRGPSGGFSSVKAVGVKFPEHEGVVVSMNMFDCINTPIYRIFEFVKQEAQRYGVQVISSQLVGPIKLEAILNTYEYYLRLENFRNDQILETHLINMD